MFGYSLIKTDDYRNLGKTSNEVIETCLSKVDNAAPISYMLGDVEVEVGMVIGIGNANYEEIKELAERGSDA